MTATTCGAAEIIRSGGPVAVPFHPCCAAVLLRAAASPAAALPPAQSASSAEAAPSAQLAPLTGTAQADPPAPLSDVDSAISMAAGLCPLVADPAAEAQLLLMTEPVGVGDP